MGKPRRTKAEKDAEWTALEGQARREFLQNLEVAQTIIDAQELCLESPHVTQPGRRYYSNLCFFLQAFNIPGDSISTERKQYLRPMNNSEAKGPLKPGVREIFEKTLQANPGIDIF